MIMIDELWLISQDDIFLTFSTISNPTDQDAALVGHPEDAFIGLYGLLSFSPQADEVTSKWVAFIHNMDPNIPPVQAEASPSAPGSLKDSPSPAPKPRATTGVSLRELDPLATSGSLPSQGLPGLHPPSHGINTPRLPRAAATGTATPPARPRADQAVWRPFRADSGVKDIYAIGGGAATGCSAQGLWGSEVQYDWQLYG